MKDAAIDEIRETRHKISECFAHDPTALVEHYRELEKQYLSKKHTPLNICAVKSPSVCQLLTPSRGRKLRKK